MLEIENIEVNYHHSLKALRGLSLNVAEGQIVALLGTNGAGKTTTLKAASNLLALEHGSLVSGRIRYDGGNIAKLEPDELVRQGLFHVREGRRIFVEMTVEENLIAASYALTGRGLRPDYEKVYAFFPQLAKRRRQVAGFLSGGEQQMLALGRAMVARPRMILMDEPSLGLAPLVVDEIFETILSLNQEDGVTILLVEQNASVAFSIAHRAYVMEHGRIVIEGKVETLRADPDVQSFYLGVGNGGTISYRDVKHYKRRKRWLS